MLVKVEMNVYVCEQVRVHRCVFSCRMDVPACMCVCVFVCVRVYVCKECKCVRTAPVAVAVCGLNTDLYFFF